MCTWPGGDASNGGDNNRPGPPRSATPTQENEEWASKIISLAVYTDLRCSGNGAYRCCATMTIAACLLAYH